MLKKTVDYQKSTFKCYFLNQVTRENLMLLKCSSLQSNGHIQIKKAFHFGYFDFLQEIPFHLQPNIMTFIVNLNNGVLWNCGFGGGYFRAWVISVGMAV